MYVSYVLHVKQFQTKAPFPMKFFYSTFLASIESIKRVRISWDHVRSSAFVALLVTVSVCL